MMNIFIVDMIEGFARKGALASSRVEALIPKQAKFLEHVPADSNVVFVCDCHGPNDPEFKRMPKHCEKGTEEANICHELLEVVQRRRLNYIIVPKTTHSAFFETDLDKDPLILGHNNWVMFGCVTDICITANVMEMDYRGKNVTLLRDLINTYDIPGHDPQIYNELFLDNYLPNVWGVKVITSQKALSSPEKIFS